MKIYCCQCQKEVSPRLTDGEEIYPHRKDLWLLHFWKCIYCGNYVGCHNKIGNGLQPLGVIPTPELRDARIKIHALLDFKWKSGKMKRRKVYAQLTKRLGYQYHSAEISSMEEAKHIYNILKEIN